MGREGDPAPVPWGACEDRSDPGSGFPSVAHAHAFGKQTVLKLGGFQI